MAKTSGYHPGSPNQTTERDMPTRKTKQVTQKGYKKSKVALRTPSPAKRKRATKTPSPLKRKKVARNTPSPTKGNRKAPPED